MSARTFISFMLLLLVVTSLLLVVASPAKQETQKKECPAGEAASGDTRMQAADGSMIWESVSRHLLSAVQ